MPICSVRRSLPVPMNQRLESFRHTVRVLSETQSVAQHCCTPCTEEAFAHRSRLDSVPVSPVPSDGLVHQRCPSFTGVVDLFKYLLSATSLPLRLTPRQGHPAPPARVVVSGFAPTRGYLGFTARNFHHYYGRHLPLAPIHCLGFAP